MINGRLNERNKRQRSTGALKIIIKPFSRMRSKGVAHGSHVFFQPDGRRSLVGTKMVKKSHAYQQISCFKSRAIHMIDSVVRQRTGETIHKAVFVLIKIPWFRSLTDARCMRAHLNQTDAGRLADI